MLPRGQMKENGNEFMYTISISHQENDPLFYLLLFRDGRERRYLERRASEEAAARQDRITPTSHKLFIEFDFVQERVQLPFAVRYDNTTVRGTSDV